MPRISSPHCKTNAIWWRQGIFTARRRDGSEFPVEIALAPIESADGLVVFASIRDVTVQRQAQEDLQRQSEDLARSNEELERFAYVASHDEGFWFTIIHLPHGHG